MFFPFLFAFYLKYQDYLTLCVKMTLTAWNGYKRYAWGADELRPLNKSGLTSSNLEQDIGLTIIDSMTTLFLMNLTNEFNLAKDWISNEFSINIVRYFFPSLN